MEIGRGSSDKKDVDVSASVLWPGLSSPTLPVPVPAPL